MQRRLIPSALAALSILAACQANAAPPPPPPVHGPPAIPDTQPAVDAPLFVGQTAFANPLPATVDTTPSLVTTRVDGANSGVVDGQAPLGTAPVTGSAAVAIEPPLLWSRAGLITGCRIQVEERGIATCLAAVDSSTMTVTARWVPPGQSLDLLGAVLDSQGRVVVTSEQGHLFVVSRPSGAGGSFQVVRDVDLSGHLDPGQVLAFAAADVDGNLWFSTGPTSALGTPATNTTVGYVTPGDQIVTTVLAGQLVGTAPAVNGDDVYLASAPSGPAVPEPAAADEGAVFDLTATGTAVQTRWREPYDAGTSIKPGAEVRGTGAPVVLLGGQYLAVTDNADGQEHLLVFLQGALPAATPAATTTSTSTSGPRAGSAGAAAGAGAGEAAVTGGSGSSADPRLVCKVGLFASGASAVTAAPIGYAAGGTATVIVANGYGTPPAPVSAAAAGAGAASDSAIDNGPANNLDSMPGGLTRVDLLANASGCQTIWSAPVRLQSAPVLSTTAGLLYGYTEDPARAATGIYVWYFAGIDFRGGNVMWQQRAGAGATKNDAGLPTEVGADGVLYQLLPLGLVWMHDVNQQP